MRSQKDADWLIKLRDCIPVYFIESQRLVNVSLAQSLLTLPSIFACSNDLANRMQDNLTNYAKLSQSLDRTFPARVIDRQKSLDLPSLTEEQVFQKLDKLEQTRSHLVEIGLLDKDNDLDIEIHPHTIDEGVKNTLLVYIQDMEQKLSVFNEIRQKINVFRKITNSKLMDSYKQIVFDKNKGFTFTTHSNSLLTNTEKIFPTDLSSGEQHEIVLLYELLFKVEPNTLVLIDEPEISLHVGWQVDFLKDLQEITKLVDIDILIATHSPDIIHDRWDLTVELQGVKA
jgi:hypothetical protein